MKVKFLQARNGDCIWITFPDENNIARNILVDGGTSKTYGYKDKKGKKVKGSLQQTLREIEAMGAESKIDLLILTHVDDDHIGGLLKWFSEDENFYKLVRKIWFNSSRLIAQELSLLHTTDRDLGLKIKEGLFTSYKQGVTFESLAQARGLLHDSLIVTGQVYPFYNAQLRIVSPQPEKLKILFDQWPIDQKKMLTSLQNDYQKPISDHMTQDKYFEDDAVHNGSSIAFLFTYQEKNYLFLSDAHPSEVVQGLTYFGYTPSHKLVAEFVKLSHHGSKGNTSKELLEIIDCSNFVISSDGKRHSLPHKQCLARIIKYKHKPTLLFNYPDLINKIFQEKDLQQNNFIVKSTTDAGIDVIT